MREEYTPEYYRSQNGDLIQRSANDLEPNEFRAIMRFNILKYAERAGKKTADPVKDLEKIQVYAQRWIEYEMENGGDNRDR